MVCQHYTDDSTEVKSGLTGARNGCLKAGADFAGSEAGEGTVGLDAVFTGGLAEGFSWFSTCPESGPGGGGDTVD